MNKKSNNKEKKFSNFSSNAVKIAALCLFSLGVISVSFASYTTQDEGNDSSRVASFNVEAVDTSAWEYQMTELFCRYDISENVDDGAYQYLAYKVTLNSKSEVDVRYTVNGINFPDSKHLKPEFVDVLLIDGANIVGESYPIDNADTDDVTEGPAWKEQTEKDINSDDTVNYKDNAFYASTATVYTSKIEEIKDTNNTTISQIATFDNVATETADDTLTGVLETAGGGTKTDDFYIVFRVDFEEFNEEIEKSESEPYDEDFMYKEASELDNKLDSYMRYLKEFDFEIDINFVQID